MQSKTISVSAVARQTAPGKYHVTGRDVPAGLYLRIEGKARYWQLRYVVDGRERWMGLGPHATIGTDGAKERARAARVLLLDGRDPISERQAAKVEAKAAAQATVSFREAAQRFHEHHAGRWTNDRMRKQWISQVEAYTFPVLGALPVASIDRATVLRCFTPHWQAGKTVTTAYRVLGRVAQILDFCTQHGWRSGDNPAEWKHLQHALAKPTSLTPAKQMQALPWTEVPAFFASLDTTVLDQAIKFTILTAVRSGEALQATWTEVDMERGVWTIPAARMKARREHIVPLSREAIAILSSLPREKGNPHVFVGARKGRPLGEKSMIASLWKRRGRSFTMHGFRASFKTWASEKTSFAPDWVEMSLAHHVGNSIERTYNRAQLIERRRALMQAWANHVTGTETAGKVVKLRVG
jgi:integrase